jgi:hypothetical protein
MQEELRDEVDYVLQAGPTLARLYRGNTGPTADRFNNSSESL